MGKYAPVPTDKGKTVQVIGAGIARTGTLSLARALEKLLDGPVMHGGVQALDREDSYVKIIVDFMRNRDDKQTMMKLLREFTAGFVGTTDSPGYQFVPELLELYPDAKVVLVTRNPERWVKSVRPVYEYRKPWWLKYLVWPYPGWRWLPELLIHCWEKEAERLPLSAGRPPTVDMLEEHNQWVRDNVPPEKLLVMSLGEGWEPLCRFLGKPVPDVPFPHANDMKTLEGAARTLIFSCLGLWTAILSSFGFSAWILFKMYL